MKYPLMLFLLALPFAVAAQQTEGKITYRQSVQVDIDESRLEQMPEERRARMKERMKSWGKSKQVLVFTATESLFRNYNAQLDAKDNAAWEAQNQGGRWRRMRPQRRIYRLHADQSLVEQREAFDKKFLIQRAEQKPQWKFTGQSATILEYPCLEAVYRPNDSTVITAWFSTQIPVSSGPAGYGELPGLILKLDINNGKTLIEATEVEFRAIEDGEIEKPTKGKAVTQEEFDRIMREKRQEMREIYGNGRGRFGG